MDSAAPCFTRSCALGSRGLGHLLWPCFVSERLPSSALRARRLFFRVRFRTGSRNRSIETAVEHAWRVQARTRWSVRAKTFGAWTLRWAPLPTLRRLSGPFSVGVCDDLVLVTMIRHVSWSQPGSPVRYDGCCADNQTIVPLHDVSSHLYELRSMDGLLKRRQRLAQWDQGSRRRSPYLELCEPRVCLTTVGFSPHVINEIESGEAAQVATADLDGDGDLDLITAGERGVHWYKNQGGFSSFHANEVSGAPATSVQAVDMDHDGDLDLFARFVGGRFAWHENRDGKGTFTQNALSTFAFVNFADLDGDGDLDAISLQELEFTWHETQGTEVGDGPRHKFFIEIVPEDWDHEAEPPILSLADLDGDKDLDILATPLRFAGNVAWYENSDGRGDFARPVRIERGIIPRTTLSDFDGDGDIDILLSEGDIAPSSTAWYENTGGKGDFQRRTSLGLRRHMTWIADLDDDGLDDIVSTHFSGILSWSRRTDNGIAYEPEMVIANAESFDTVIVEDLDGDADIDVLVLTPSGVTWYASDVVDSTNVVRLIGDANESGFVDERDVAVLMSNFGKQDAAWSDGDFNHDRSVSFEDFLLLAQQFSTEVG